MYVCIATWSSFISVRRDEPNWSQFTIAHPAQYRALPNQKKAEYNLPIWGFRSSDFPGKREMFVSTCTRSTGDAPKRPQTSNSTQPHCLSSATFFFLFGAQDQVFHKLYKLADLPLLKPYALQITVRPPVRPKPLKEKPIHLEPGTRKPKPKTQNTEPGIRNPENMQSLVGFRSPRCVNGCYSPNWGSRSRAGTEWAWKSTQWHSWVPHFLSSSGRICFFSNVHLQFIIIWYYISLCVCSLITIPICFHFICISHASLSQVLRLLLVAGMGAASSQNSKEQSQNLHNVVNCESTETSQAHPTGM